MGYRCLKQGGGGETLECYMSDVKKTRADLKSSDVTVRAKALAKQKNAYKLAKQMPKIGKILAKSFQVGKTGLTGFLNFTGVGQPIAWAIEGIVEGGFYDYYRRKGYSHDQAFAETFTPRLLKEGFRSTEDVPWYGGAEKLREKELIGDAKQNPKVLQYVKALKDQERIYDAFARKETGKATEIDKYTGTQSHRKDILDKASADIRDLAKTGTMRYVDQIMDPESMASQAYHTEVEKQQGLDQRRKEEYLEKYEPGAWERERKILSRPRQLEKRYKQMYEMFPKYTNEDMDEMLNRYYGMSQSETGRSYDELKQMFDIGSKQSYYADNFRLEKAGGGIAGVRRPNAIAPESGPAPQGEGLSYILNSVKEW